MLDGRFKILRFEVPDKKRGTNRPANCLLRAWHIFRESDESSRSCSEHGIQEYSPSVRNNEVNDV